MRDYMQGKRDKLKNTLFPLLETLIDKMDVHDSYEIYTAMRNAYLEKKCSIPDRPGWGYDEPWLGYTKPFKIFGNLYYVGDEYMCCHIIDTGDGLIMIDAGMAGSYIKIVNAIWEMGLNPNDIKWLILTHHHVDHIGGVNFFKNMYGCEILISDVDAYNMREYPAKTYVQDFLSPYEELFTPDREIHDGEEIVFGNTTMKFVLVPGHTDGTLAMFFDVSDGEKTYRAGLFGGYGMNGIDPKYLEDFGDTEHKMMRTFIESVEKVRDEKVEIFLGNHPFDNQTIEKQEYMNAHPGENPFIDSEAWGIKMDAQIETIKGFIARFEG